jgi:ribosomal protein S18 acetylase RimI-like enzyme
MAALVDPTDALVSFQREVRGGRLHAQPVPGADVVVHLDRLNGRNRFTYAAIKHRKVMAFAMFAECEAIQGLLCFQLGVAVPEAYRGQGRAKKIVNTGLRELQRGLARNGLRSFYIEAIVAADNNASQRVAASVFMVEPKKVTDHNSGLPALQFVRLIGDAFPAGSITPP